MKIIILNGSPKGDMSITMQYIEFLRNKYKQHTLQQINVARYIQKLEQDKHYFDSIINETERADGIIWGFPVYYFLVPSQYKRFIELIFERDMKKVFYNKYTVSLSTSVHFYDHAAHNYIHAICDDLEMKYIDKFSADMYGLLNKKYRNALINFIDDFLIAIEQKRPTQPEYAPLSKRNFVYKPKDEAMSSHVKIVKTKKLIIITDTVNRETNLGKMVHYLQKCMPEITNVVDLNALDIKGGCVGCLQCGYNNACTYDKNDGFTDFFKKTIDTADVLIYAATIKDRFISSEWKLLFDRSFFLGHIPSFKNKQIGFIISGSLSEIPNIHHVLEAYIECLGANNVGFVTDEVKQSNVLDMLLYGFADRIARFAHINYKSPPTFLSIGGRKILRDDVVWGRLRFIFQADHRYYKKYGLYDFPHRDIKGRIITAVMMFLTRIHPFRKKFMKGIRKQMIVPHRKLVRKIKTERK